jgi:hypothetical protein
MGTLTDMLSDIEYEINNLTKDKKYMVIASFPDSVRENLEVVDMDLDWESAVRLAEQMNLEEIADKVIICEQTKFMYW